VNKPTLNIGVSLVYAVGFDLLMFALTVLHQACLKWFPVKPVHTEWKLTNALSIEAKQKKRPRN
jgi:hypothetical protein